MKSNSPASPIESRLQLLDSIVQYPEDFRQTVLKAARSQSGILHSVGLNSEEVPGMIYAHLCRKRQPEFQSLSAVRGYIYCCTLNLLRSIGRKNTTRKKLFDDSVDVHKGEDFHGEPVQSPASVVESIDEARAIFNAAQGDPMEAKVFQCAHALLQEGNKATTINVADRLGLPYSATYRLRLNLQRRVLTALRNGHAPTQKGILGGNSSHSTLTGPSNL